VFLVVNPGCYESRRHKPSPHSCQPVLLLGRGQGGTDPRSFRFAQQVERAKAKGLHGDELGIYVRALGESYAAKEGLERRVLVVAAAGAGRRRVSRRSFRA
jgi:hypothetical protein